MIAQIPRIVISICIQVLLWVVSLILLLITNVDKFLRRLLVHFEVHRWFLGLSVRKSSIFKSRLSLELHVMIQMTTRCLTKFSKVNATRALLPQLLVFIQIFRWLGNISNNDVRGILTLFLLLRDDSASLVSFDRRVSLSLVWAIRSSLGHNWRSHLRHFIRLLMPAILQTWRLLMAVIWKRTHAWPLIQWFRSMRFFPYVSKVDLARLKSFFQLHSIIFVGSRVLAVLFERVLGSLVLRLSLFSRWKLRLKSGLNKPFVLFASWLAELVSHAEAEWFFLDIWRSHAVNWTITVSRESDLVAVGDVGTWVIFADRQNRNRLLDGRQVLLKEAKREELAIENLLASHVLLIRAKYSNLRKFGSRIGVTSAKFTIFVVAPAVKISILVHCMAKILSNSHIAQLSLTLDIGYLF